MKNAICLLSVILILAVTGNVYAQDMVKASAEKAIEAGFSELERQMIKKYLGDQKQSVTTAGAGGNKNSKPAKGMPSGPAKRDSLPPGLAAQLKRNGTLPPGLAKRALPADLVRQLPPVREGYERSILEDMTVVLIETATGRIADIIVDAVLD